jgi:hypothetical protein
MPIIVNWPHLAGKDERPRDCSATLKVQSGEEYV